VETSKRVSQNIIGNWRRWRLVNILLEGELACPLDRFGLFVQVVVLVGRGEIWLVADIHDGVDAGAVGFQICLGGVGLENIF
jgi:hypothetical protein